MEKHILNIKQLLALHKLPAPHSLQELPSSGSPRVYFRIFFEDSNQTGLIASYNENIGENIAQYSFTQHFLNKGFRVPKIIARDESYRYFLLEDLGSSNLFQRIQEGVNEDSLAIYKQVIQDLLLFQTDGCQDLDLDVAYPVKAFSKRAVMWDLNYFKYYFVKPHKIDFDENKLEDDFQVFSDYLLQAEMNFFNYRDFQSRNIMLRGETPWYIDFQGGRRGPLQYDLVSLLYQAKANLPDILKEQLLQYYLENLEKKLPGKADEFLKYYREYILFRTMQVLGAYGFRGKIEGKTHFLQSIPFALLNLNKLINENTFNLEIPELEEVLNKVAAISSYQKYELSPENLTISICSFSYKKKGIPPDPTDNGGGFIFDCRALPNPHRDIKLREYNGTQKPIVDFLEKKPEMHSFLNHVYQICEQSIDNYIDRKFNHLQISFGCTGGKHRSVFSAEQLAKYLSEKYPNQLDIRLKHQQLEVERKKS